MQEKLTIVTANYNTSLFIRNLVITLEKTTSNPFKILICDNGSNFWDKLRLLRIAEGNKRITVIFRTQSAKSSIGHAEALNLLIDQIDTPYGVMLDADAAFLKKGWDERLIDKLDEETKLIGAPPVPNPVKPTDFPSVYVTLFETETFHSLDIDMRPDDPSEGRDTGWEMRKRFREEGLNAICFEVKNTRNYEEGPFGHLTTTEYYLNSQDHIIASHFGRGASLGEKKYYKNYNSKIKPVQIGMNIFEKYRTKYQGFKERREWIRTCRSIVKNQ